MILGQILRFGKSYECGQFCDLRNLMIFRAVLGQVPRFLCLGFGTGALTTVP